MSLGKTFIISYGVKSSGKVLSGIGSFFEKFDKLEASQEPLTASQPTNSC